MKRSGQADLPLHYGKVPSWLYTRMSAMGSAILEAIIEEYGSSEVLSRLSDPFWFQSLGSVLGMDWHSSGITTSVLGALKSGTKDKAQQLGLYFCGGRGKHSLKTPDELTQLSEKTGLNGNSLVRSSKLTAKIDNTAIQDGYQLYLHSFVVNNKGEWAVIQQGMNPHNRYARRYHWHSATVKSFVDEPHAAVVGDNLGEILNLTHHEAGITRQGVLNLTHEKPEKIIDETRYLTMPGNHDVQEKDLDLKRLGAALAIAYEGNLQDFESLLLVKGLGPKTLRSLVHVSEIIHGTPSRFSDPARFSFAHGGKDGHPFPVQTKVFDQSIDVLKRSLEKARMDHSDRNRGLKKLHEFQQEIEKQFMPNNAFYDYIDKERRESAQVGGRTVFDKKSTKKVTKNPPDNGPIQLRFFD
ncbi:MAG: DUF763 domain-containing protein [Bacteroidota bacterium]